MLFSLVHADSWLAIVANRLARGTSPSRLAIGVLARWLAVVEITLMVMLAVRGRRNSAARMLVSVGTVYVACDVLGRVCPRTRPFAALPSEVSPLVRHGPERSFPSRHVAAGLAMASVGGAAHPSLGRIMTAVAWLLGLSRIAAGLHYPSDVLGGAILGVAVGRYARGV